MQLLLLVAANVVSRKVLALMAQRVVSEHLTSDTVVVVSIIVALETCSVRGRGCRLMLAAVHGWELLVHLLAPGRLFLLIRANNMLSS